MKNQYAIALASLALCATAAAQPYVVGSVGLSRLSADCTGVSNCDKTDVGYKALGGFRFAPNFAAEFGYADFGKAKASQDGVAASIGNTAFLAGGAYHQELAPNWNFVARLGAARVKTKISGSVDGAGSASESDKNTTFYGGLGVGYKLSKALSVDAAWDISRSKFKKLDVDESGNINMFSIGLTLGF